MIFLQAPAPSFGIFETLTQYGALGVITLGLGAALWFLLKRQIASEDNLKKQVDDLQKEINNYAKNDSMNIKNSLDNNTRALHDLKEIIMQSSIRQKRL